MSRIDRFWAGFFGVAERALTEPGVRVVPHAKLGEYDGAWIFVHGDAGIVSVPAACVPAVEALARGLSAHELQKDVARIVSREIERTIGPVYLGWVEGTMFRDEGANPGRAISPDERGAVARLRAACDPGDWEASGIEGSEPDLFGSFSGEILAAVAKLRPSGDGAGDVGVVSHPALRRRGHALAAVSALVREALDRGVLVLYQTLDSNTGARAIAGRLGFARYARNVAVRFEPRA